MAQAGGRVSLSRAGGSQTRVRSAEVEAARAGFLEVVVGGGLDLEDTWMLSIQCHTLPSPSSTFPLSPRQMGTAKAWRRGKKKLLCRLLHTAQLLIEGCAVNQALPLVSSPPSCSLLTFPSCHLPRGGPGRLSSPLLHESLDSVPFFPFPAQGFPAITSTLNPENGLHVGFSPSARLASCLRSIASMGSFSFHSPA